MKRGVLDLDRFLKDGWMSQEFSPYPLNIAPCKLKKEKTFPFTLSPQGTQLIHNIFHKT